MDIHRSARGTLRRSHTPSVRAPALRLCAVALLLVAARPVRATTYTVNSTGGADDDGGDFCNTDATITGGANDGQPECTFRAAVTSVTAGAGGDTIAFGIDDTQDVGCNSGTHVCTIAVVDGETPNNLSVAMTIDGSTQSHAVGGAPTIVFDGTALTAGAPFPSITADNVTVILVGVQNNTGSGSDCLQVHGDASALTWLNISGCEDGIYISGAGHSATITHLFSHDNRHNGLNLDQGASVTITSSILLRNAQSGINFNTLGGMGATSSTVGGATDADGAIVGGNGVGISIHDSTVSNITVTHNFLGYDADGTSTLCDDAESLTDNGTGDTIANNTINPACLPTPTATSVPIPPACVAVVDNGAGIQCVDSAATNETITSEAFVQDQLSGFGGGTVVPGSLNTTTNCTDGMGGDDTGDLFNGVCPPSGPSSTPAPATATSTVTATPTPTNIPTANSSPGWAGICRTPAAMLPQTMTAPAMY